MSQTSRLYRVWCQLRAEGTLRLYCCQTYYLFQFNFTYSKGLLWNLLQANHFYKYVLNHELQQGHAYTVWRYELTRYGYGARPSFWWIHNRLVSSLLLPTVSLLHRLSLSCCSWPLIVIKDCLLLICSLLVPPGSLREPMFGTYRPDVINYGKLGVYMASRMFHVLDTYGTHFENIDIRSCPIKQYLHWPQ